MAATMQWIADEALAGGLVKHRLEAVGELACSARQRLEGVNIGLLRSCIGALDAVSGKISEAGLPLVEVVDQRISRVAATLQTASQPRDNTPVPTVNGLSREQLREDLTKRRLIRARCEDIAAVTNSLYSRLDDSNAVVRVGLRGMEKATSIIVAPLAEKVSVISSPLVDSIDERIGSVAETGEAFFEKVSKELRQRIHSGLELLSSVDASAARGSTNKEDLVEQMSKLRDAVYVGLIAYAEGFIEHATHTALATKSREQLDIARSRLEDVKASLGPHYERAMESLSAHSFIQRLRTAVEHSREAGRKAVTSTVGVTGALLDNVGEAYGKTKNLTESTLLYFDSKNIMVIPSEVFEFCSMAMGWREKDAQYNEVATRFKDLFDSLSNVFVLSQHSEQTQD